MSNEVYSLVSLVEISKRSGVEHDELLRLQDLGYIVAESYDEAEGYLYPDTLVSEIEEIRDINILQLHHMIQPLYIPDPAVSGVRHVPHPIFWIFQQG